MTRAPTLQTLRLNPIWQKSVRARMRPRHLLSWGIVTLTFTAFVATIVYTNMTEHQLTTPKDAAKAVLPAVIVVQAILLMMFGTGAVAAGISQERDEGLLDYQRMTPMRPTAKILGYLFGLPVREYTLFAMTLPIVAAAVAFSGFSLLTLAHFYAVFFTSVLVYHMTAMVAGMVAPKPRLASMLSIGLVAVLYFALPNLSRVGITFFEFLTIRPTFFGLIQQELPAHMRPAAEATGIDSFRYVPMFGGLVHPTIYTLMVQGFLIATMFSVVHRKWRDQALHAFSKAGALVVFAGVVFFLMGSIWALVVQDEAYSKVFELFDRVTKRGGRSPETLEILLSIGVVISGLAYLALVAAITPSRHTTLAGWRRARKLGRTSLGPNSDAASSLPTALVMIAIAIVAGALLLQRVGVLGAYYQSGPSAASIVVLLAGFVGVALFVQGLREWLSLRVFGIGLFALWMIPFFAMMVLYSAFEMFVAGTYAGLACPPVLLVYAIGEMLRTTTTLPGVSAQFLPHQLGERAGEITTVGACGYAAAGVLVQVLRFRARARLRTTGLAATPADDAPGAR